MVVEGLGGRLPTEALPRPAVERGSDRIDILRRPSREVCPPLRATACVELWQDGDDAGVTVTNTVSTRPSLSLPGSQQDLLGVRERADILHGAREAGPTRRAATGCD